MKQQYSSYDECVSFFKAAQKKLPNIFRVESIGKTHEERDIIVVTMSQNLKEADSKPALFYTGTIHAREWIGIELALAFGQYVLEYLDLDPKLSQMLDAATFYMVPCANPDGYEYSRNHFSFWRKNRRQNADGSFGVDLNRNFSVGYAPSSTPTSNVYSGPAPFSEPETLALKNFVEDHPNITIALDYHSQGNVFFPAHNFIHEDAIDATDLNVLAANMAEEIRKVSGREYGVHMGKPPTHLISGSGREFYYSQGALALVVEVGTRNISDYLEHMTQNIEENIPALMNALNEVPNYAKENGLPRVKSFRASFVSSNEVEVSWEYDADEQVYFEIYRSSKQKGFATASNRIGITKDRSFNDRHLSGAKNYYYFIRAVCKERHVKSPFASVLGVRTLPEREKFSKILYPRPNEVGYVGEKTAKNSDHFGNNSLFVGVSQSRGECYGVTRFSLDTVPENAIITEARISYYPMNRVSVQVERYGEWRVGLVDDRELDSISSFHAISNAKILAYIDRPTKSHQLSQGIWRTYTFASQEIAHLQEAIKRRSVLFRMDGPKELPLDRASQLMQWDIGYGKFSGGLTFRPMLEISYTLQDAKIELLSLSEHTITRDEAIEQTLQVGFNAKGERSYGAIEFDLSQLPYVDTTIISEAYIELDALQIKADNNIRFHIELIDSEGFEVSYKGVKARKIIERIGYEVSVDALKNNSSQRFVFDTYAIAHLVEATKKDERLRMIMYATSEKMVCKSQSVAFEDVKKKIKPKLIIHYIKKRRNAPEMVSNLRQSVEKGKIRLDWDNPKDDAFKGVLVVKNPFHVPSTPYDGEKLYGGRDNYTYDSFGDRHTHKYYAVFAYDDVPNFSAPATFEYTF